MYVTMCRYTLYEPFVAGHHQLEPHARKSVLICRSCTFATVLSYERMMYIRSISVLEVCVCVCLCVSVCVCVNARGWKEHKTTTLHDLPNMHHAFI